MKRVGSADGVRLLASDASCQRHDGLSHFLPLPFAFVFAVFLRVSVVNSWFVSPNEIHISSL